MYLYVYKQIANMGVKNFIKFLELYIPEAIKCTYINKYKNKTLGIDANLLLYKIIYAIRSRGYDLKNKEHLVTHIHTLLLKLIAFKQYNINAIFVFDTKQPKIKHKTLNKRIDVKNKLIEKYKDTNTEEGKRIYYYIKTDITTEEFEQCRYLINIFGYNIIDAKEEADAQLAQLWQNKIIDYIVSDDMDILLFGGNMLLKNFTVDSKKKIKEINSYYIFKNLNITHKILINIGVLLGTDYCDNKTYSPKKTYCLIEKYKYIKNIPDFATDCENAINYFIKPPVYYITASDIPHEIKIDKKKLRNFLENFMFDKKYIDNIFDKIK